MDENEILGIAFSLVFGLFILIMPVAMVIHPHTDEGKAIEALKADCLAKGYQGYKYSKNGINYCTDGPEDRPVISHHD